MDEKKIERAFAEEKIVKAITCPQAFAIAEKHNIPKEEISEYPQYVWDQNPGVSAWLFQIIRLQNFHFSG